MIQTLLLLRVPAVVAELFVAAVSSWIGLNIHKTLRDPKTPPAESVLLDVRLGLVAVFWLSAFLTILF